MAGVSRPHFLPNTSPQRAQLTYVNAGHNTPILRRASGASSGWSRAAFRSAFCGNAPYEVGIRYAASGDWLVVFTDGVVEAENDRADEYGEQRLLYVVHMGARWLRSMLLQSIMTDLDRFVGGAPQHDDVTCMLVKAS